MITVTTSSHRILEFIRHCNISHQHAAVGLTGFRVTFRLNSLEDLIKWHDGVYRTQIVLRYLGLNTYEVSDTDDVRTKILMELSSYHARHTPLASEVSTEDCI